MSLGKENKKMRRLKIHVDDIRVLTELNTCMNDSRYKDLKFSIGHDEEYMLNAKSILSMIFLYGHVMYIHAYGINSVINEFLIQLNGMSGIDLLDDKSSDLQQSH